MSKRTPGPWLVLPIEEDKNYIRVRGSQLGTKYKIANVITDEVYVDQGINNARLIAAAPDMLMALEGMMQIVSKSLGVAGGQYPDDEYMHWEEFAEVQASEAAIKKAKGEA